MMRARTPNTPRRSSTAESSSRRDKDSLGRARRRLPTDAACVDRRTLAVDRLEVHFIADEFNQHERIRRVIAVRGQRRLLQVPLPQLRRASDDEIRDALLRLDPLV